MSWFAGQSIDEMLKATLAKRVSCGVVVVPGSLVVAVLANVFA